MDGQIKYVPVLEYEGQLNNVVRVKRIIIIIIRKNQSASLIAKGCRVLYMYDLFLKKIINLRSVFRKQFLLFGINYI